MSWIFLFLASSSSITAFVAAKQLCACHVQVALLWLFLGLPWCQVMFPTRSRLFCCSGFGCVCLSHVSVWLRLVEVFAVVPFECRALCRVGSGDTLLPLGRKQVVSSRHHAHTLIFLRIFEKVDDEFVLAACLSYCVCCAVAVFQIAGVWRRQGGQQSERRGLCRLGRLDRKFKAKTVK